MPSSETSKPSEQARDKTVEDTFPASDPPANSGITGAEGKAKPAQKADTEAQPTGHPSSDRHAMETAHHDEADPQTSDPSTKPDLGRQRA